VFTAKLYIIKVLIYIFLALWTFVNLFPIYWMFTFSLKDNKEIFGENVYIFTPDDDPEVVKETMDNIYKKQETNQFGKERYALMFMPGVYDESIEVNVGYYTSDLKVEKSYKDSRYASAFMR